MSTTDETSKVEAESPTALFEDRPPPLPPKDNATWRAAALPTPSADSRKETASPPSPPRLKKKMPWKGKNIMVLLPMDDERGKHGKAPAPMSEHDVDAMLREWQQLGYDTTGFNLGYMSDEDVGSGQSRCVWPGVADIDIERAQRAFRVSIPDRRRRFTFDLLLTLNYRRVERQASCIPH